MYIKRNTPLYYLTAWPLNTASLVFKTLSLLNLKWKGRNPARYPEATVISIDNLSFGGTGKTTLVLEIGKHLEQRQIKFAIVTRGYRSTFESRGALVQPVHSARDVGDEAKLFSERFPQQDIFIGQNRHASIKQAIARKNTVILLDDGFQSTDIEKDIKIMLFNPRHPYYYLRNFKFLMRREDYVLFYHPENAAAVEGEAGTRLTAPPAAPVSPFTPGKPVYGTYHFRLEGFYTGIGDPVDVSDAALLGFSALGDNLRFKTDLSAFRLVGFRGYPDHHAYGEADLETLDRERIRAKAEYLVCTEKDFIKIKHLNLTQIPLIYCQNRLKLSLDIMGRVVNDAEAKSKV